MSTRQLDLLASGAKAPTAKDAGGGRGRRRGGGSGGGGGGGGDEPPTPPADASLASEAQRRYLNYAVSVITARALPDVRDGLKPVQRRILYAMYANLHLYPDVKHRKSATIVGEVLGKFHPHGDTSCYDAMVRMAQPFSMRVPLVEGHGNFGSLDGDAAAAYRYTEARLAPLAMELLGEIKQGTVDFRPNYDGTTEEPIVLPANVPQLLINGCTGIAAGHGDQHPAPAPRQRCARQQALIDDPSSGPRILPKITSKGPASHGESGSALPKSLRPIITHRGRAGQGAGAGQWGTVRGKGGRKSSSRRSPSRC
jgi:DNA gyrase subunit A